MKRIPLTQGQFALVDDEDYEELKNYKWCATYCRKTRDYYAIRNIKKAVGKQKSILMHRIIMNAQSGQCIDHINHNSLDNRKCNLRICSIAENNRNRINRASSISKYKGVGYDKNRRKWYARIKFNKKNKWLGYCKTEKEAAKKYNIVAIKLFGEYAHVN